MVFLLIGLGLLLGIFVAIYLGMRHSYTASEGLLALVLLQSFFIGVLFLIYGLVLIFQA